MLSAKFVVSNSSWRLTFSIGSLHLASLVAIEGVSPPRFPSNSSSPCDRALNGLLRRRKDAGKNALRVT